MSLVSLWLRMQIYALRPVLSRFDAKAGRRVQDKLGQLGARVLSTLVEYTEADGFAADRACMAVRREPLPDGEGVAKRGVILYLHGGGYVAGGLEYAKLYGGVLAVGSGLPVLCLDYALAPEQPYPAAMADTLLAYGRLMGRGYEAGEIIIAGESAGGGLALGLMHRLKSLGLPLPAGIICISPWTDLTLSGASLRYNARSDVSLTMGQLEYFVRCYAPNDVTLAEVSPALHSFEGFPPVLVFAGGDEILLDDARAVLRGCHAAKVPCRLMIQKRMWHAWPLYPTPESGKALAHMVDFMGRWL